MSDIIQARGIAITRAVSLSPALRRQCGTCEIKQCAQSGRPHCWVAANLVNMAGIRTCTVGTLEQEAALYRAACVTTFNLLQPGGYCMYRQL